METTILFGNGVNRLSDNGIEWKELLRKVSGMLGEIPDFNNNTMLFEYITLPEAVPLADRDGNPFYFSDGEPWLAKNVTEEDVKKGLKDILKDGKSWFYKNLADLHADHYLTTNYELYLNEEFTICPKKSCQEKHDGVESLLYDHEVGIRDGHKASLWNIHGNTKCPQSILLGMNEYCKYVVAIEEYLQKKDPNKKSWVDLMTETNVHIVGLGLAFEEIDLWYLLTRRMRRFKQNEPINNKIFFYQIAEKGKHNNAVTQMLVAAGVEVVPIEIHNKTEKGDWKKAYQEIYKEIKQHLREYRSLPRCKTVT